MGQARLTTNNHEFSQNLCEFCDQAHIPDHFLSMSECQDVPRMVESNSYGCTKTGNIAAPTGCIWLA